MIILAWLGHLTWSGTLSFCYALSPKLVVVALLKAAQVFDTAWKVFNYGVFSRPYSVRMWGNTDQKLRIWTLFAQCEYQVISYSYKVTCRNGSISFLYVQSTFILLPRLMIIAVVKVVLWNFQFATWSLNQSSWHR